MQKITSILVANRGEIALRIMKTARSLGIGCIAVYTEADADSPHVSFADRAICIGVGPVTESYLNTDKIIEAARETGADAVHPGYGFLSENADFARACREAGLIFIGPGAQAIALMGNKAAAKRRMQEAGVPCVPGYEGADQSVAALQKEAARIGYPVMIKAAAGGGGRGMRLVAEAAGFPAALELAKSEALSAFGSDEMILERAVQNPRHVEIQVFADAQGQVIHLGERDCSVQRRHQKVVEEAPSPAVSPDLRTRMGEAAVGAARAIGYLGAGTVEFLLDEAGDFYFLEMNTRLQVEHPVTEMVTGLDLVAMQIRCAEGLPLDLRQEDLELTGHAIEVRLYAEDPAQGFLPQAGRIHRWQAAEGAGLRIDAGIAAGQEISAFYDPMLAKLVAHGRNREEARQRLIAALQDTVLFGPATNRDFLIAVLRHPEFAAGAATTGFINRHFDSLPVVGDGAAELVLAAGLFLQEQQAASATRARLTPELLGWSSQGCLQSRICLEGPAGPEVLRIRQRGGEMEIEAQGASHQVTQRGHEMRLEGARVDLRGHLITGDELFAALGERMLYARRHRPGAEASGGGASGEIRAPMHGNLLEVCVAAGSSVAAGDRIAVLEAMKMQHEILASVSGRVSAVSALAGGQVKAGDLLAEIEVTEETA